MDCPNIPLPSLPLEFMDLPAIFSLFRMRGCDFADAHLQTIVYQLQLLIGLFWKQMKLSYFCLVRYCYDLISKFILDISVLILKSWQ